MTRLEIIFNYTQAMRQAQKLDEIAGQLERLAKDRYGDTIWGIRNAWNSDNSEQYLVKARKVQNDILETAKKLRRIAESIRTTAEAIKRAELAALDIARSRVYEAVSGAANAFGGGGGGSR